jgi:penicillin-binding protein 1B
MPAHSFKRYFKFFSVFFLIVLVAFASWVWRLNSQIQERLSHGWFRPPIELFSRGETFRVKSILQPDELAEKLRAHHYRERFEEQSLYPGDFAVLNASQCADMAHDSFLNDLVACVTFVTLKSSEHFVVVIANTSDQKNLISHIYTGTPPHEVPSASLEPELYAQFFSGQPILRTIIKIGDAPLECLQATTAIEDRDFLEHRGVSATGFLRAIARNIIAGRYAQGGSTITQQLVKNYFLTPEKTVRRKIQDMVMAILLEANLDKDQILENYLNVIYMGQRGPFEVIGFGAASEHYIGKKLSDLDLPECALLAAIINNPGKYDPAAHPDNATKRRALVLDHMSEYGMITLAKAEEAKKAALPAAQEHLLKEPAPYYTQAIFRELERLQIATDDGLRVYTALDVHAQDFAQKKILSHVENLEKTNKNIAKLKASDHNLESSLISVDVATGEVIALVGGRQFVKTQYNRVLDAHRQVGSIMKPFVYLTALENRNTDGSRFSPLTLIDDLPFVYSYEGQKWSPKNYEKEFNGPVPLFYALKMSLNAATAKLGLQVGLNNIIDVARRAGVSQSEIKSYPSLTLGAFEIFPWEVATAYLTFARFGERTPLQFIKSVENVNGAIVYTSTPATERVFAPETVAVLVSMMKQTLLTGTGRLAKLSGFNWPAAGKTGTTSDLKDTWFAGFTPHLLTVAWTGYDDNTPTTLTGATGALPLWIDFMKAVAVRFPPDDFAWPESVEKITLTPEDFKSLIPHAADYEVEGSTELVRMK